MHQKIVSLGSGKTLVIDADQDWSNLSIHQDGVLIGSIPDKAELMAGRTFTLTDGREIRVLLTYDRLEVWHKGKELLTGKQTIGFDGFGFAFKALIAAGLLQGVMGALFLFSETQYSVLFGIGASLIGFGLIALGFWARNSGSKKPFWIGIIFCVLNIIVCFVTGGLGGLMLPCILLALLYRGTKSEPFQRGRNDLLDEDAPLDSNL